MKQLETALKVKRRYALMMLVCFLYGGFAILFFFFQAYSAVWHADVVPAFDANRVFDANASFRDANFLRAPRESPFNPLDAVSSPISIVLLISGIVAILAGFSIWQLIREKEIKKVREEMAENLLLPDEKKIIQALKRNNYEATQAKIAKDSGLSKVQTHRAIKKLEAKGVLEKHSFGMTNKILLKKELIE
ncbi:MAG: winged helix-turn-helix transcriptional regulator [Candidatus Diapherotrites archaeon]